MSPELQNLILLQDIDVRSFELTDRLEAIPHERNQIEELFRQQAADYLGIEQDLDAAREDRVRVDADLAAYEEAHEKFKADLMKVRNQNEYGTVLREIDATKKSIGALETEALQLIERIEAREKELAEKAPEFAARRAEVDQMLARFDEEIAEIERELAELRSSRSGIESGVTPTMLVTYNRIAQTRKGRAMSEVRGEIGSSGKCSACNMSLRPQVFSEIRRGESLIVCDNCSRILFYRHGQETPAEASAP